VQHPQITIEGIVIDCEYSGKMGRHDPGHKVGRRRACQSVRFGFSGKTIVLFATSGSSDIGQEAPVRASQIAKTEVKASRRFSSNASTDELKDWAEQYLK
jgi:hypothetical protein